MFKKNHIEITVLQDDHEMRLGIAHEESLLQGLLRNKVSIDHSCGGMGSCGTCRVIVQSELSHLPVRNEVESELANDRGLKENERLACQLKVVSGLRIEIP